MRNSKNNQQDFEDLARQIDDLLNDSGEKIVTEDDGIDLAQFTPEDIAIDEDVIYQNYSNGYGADAPKMPQTRAEKVVTAYNQDFKSEQLREIRQRNDEYLDYGGNAPREKAVKRPSRKKKGPGCCGCGCATVLLLLAALVAGFMIVLGTLFRMPVSDEPIGARKEDTAAILLCGTDKDGTRTDTMMLVYLDGSERRVGLLSLPRDTMTITDEGHRAKLNSAYGRNGCGEEGMEWVMTYVERTIGFKPDGYILVDMELVPKVVDLMGGVNVHLDHHIRVHTDGEEVYVPAGDQHLNGEEVLATLRYRYGYSDADLGRVKVQRMVITECMKQWVTPSKLALLPEVLELIRTESITDLSVNNFLWIGKAMLTGMGNMTSDTLPGYADMRGGVSYYILYRDQVADMVNSSYNPYTTDVDPEDLYFGE